MAHPRVARAGRAWGAKRSPTPAASDGRTQAPLPLAESVVQGFYAMTIMVLIYAVLQFDNVDYLEMSFFHPFPFLWRLLRGMSLVYLLLLIFMFFQEPEFTRTVVLPAIDPTLGHELPERAYGEDCRIYAPDHPDGPWGNVKAVVLDEFVIAHILGWWGKAVMIRDFKVLVTLSIGFELCELTLHHILNNFNECWWDHIFLDVLICNAFGMWVGMLTCQYFGARQMDWVGMRDYPDAVSKVTRVVRQFTPISFTMFDWSFFMTFRRFLGTTSLIAFILMSECNAFFLKTVLWIPPNHWVNPLRVFFWWLMGIVAVREWWFFIEDSNSRKLGSQAWLALAIGLTEFFLHIKYGIAMDMYSWETIWPSRPIVIFWVVNVAGFLGYTAWYFNIRQGAAEFRRAVERRAADRAAKALQLLGAESAESSRQASQKED